MRIVAAVEPHFGILRRQFDEGAMRKPLHAGGPFDTAQSAFDRRLVAPAAAAQHGDGDGGVVDLVPADKARQRQIEQTIVVLINHAALFLMGEEILAKNYRRRAKRVGSARDNVARNIVLRADDHRYAVSDNARFFRRDVGKPGLFQKEKGPTPGRPFRLVLEGVG